MNIIGSLALLLVGLLLAWHLWVAWQSRRQRGMAVPEYDGPLAERLRAPGKRVLYFHSPRCSACRKMDPVLRALDRDGIEVCQLDVSQELELARSFQVRGTPTTVVVENGQIAAVLPGFQSERALRQHL